MQRQLLPLDVVAMEPPLSATADIDGLGTAVDGLLYAVKSVRKAPLLPATEWISSSVAEAVHVPVPPFEILKLPSHELAFGSRWEGGVFAGQNTRIAANRALLPVGAKLFSRIFALDLFLHNVDRHLNNYMFREMNRRIAVLAMDFSRALFFHGWPLPGLPLDPRCNTMLTYRALRKVHPFDLKAAADVLDAVAALPSDMAERVVQRMPSAWIAENIKKGFVDWWAGAERASRVGDIKRGLGNGHYL